MEATPTRVVVGTPGFWARQIVTKNAATARTNAADGGNAASTSLVNVLKGKGLAVNEADRAGMRAQLGGFYRRWKGEFGDKAWSLLESATANGGEPADSVIVVCAL